jgi:CelD/BcsL family acetyltransferase involved in cellulose biosynthesis
VADGDFHVTVEESLDAVGRQAWDALADACDASVFYRYDFLVSVEKQPLTHPSRALYLVVRDRAGSLAAVLPVYSQRTRDPFSAEPDGGPMLDVLAGQVWHCYDTTVLSRDAANPTLLIALWSALESLAHRLGAQMWGLVNLPLHGPVARGLSAIGVPVEETAPRYQLPMPARGGDLEAHLAGIGRESRRTMRKFLNRAERDGAKVVSVAGADGLDEDVLALCLETADKHAPGYYPADRLSALVRNLGAACRILRLERDGRLLAASICMYDNSRMHAWAGGCSYPGELNWSPQYVLFAAELTAGFASGLPMLECGRRNDAFKLRYGLRPQRLGRAVRRS